MKKLSLLLLSVVLLTGCAAGYPSMEPLSNPQALSCRDIENEIDAGKYNLVEIDMIAERKDLVVATKILDDMAKNKAIDSTNQRLDQLRALQQQKRCN